MVRRTKFNRYLIIQQGTHVWGVRFSRFVHGLSVVGSHVCYVDRVLVALAVIDSVAAPMVCLA